MNIIFKSVQNLLCIKEFTISKTDTHIETDTFVLFSDSNTFTLKKELIGSYKIPSYEFINRCCSGNFFVVIFSKTENCVIIYRDKSGVKSGYYALHNNTLVVGNNIHNVAISSRIKEFDKTSVYQLIYSEFLLDGKTIYKDLFEFKRGGEYLINDKIEIDEKVIHKLTLSYVESSLNESQIIKELRRQIVETHRPFLSKTKNIVLLSGGIDSVAMLIALDDLTKKENIKAVSIKVKGTHEDETCYAKSIADHLGIDFHIEEFDPYDTDNYVDMDNRLLLMNNPYPGMWVFGNFTETEEVMYFFGQDSRLHTPSITLLDKVAFYLKDYNKTFVVPILDKLFKRARSLFPATKLKYFKRLYKLTYVFNIQEYISKFFFGLDREEYMKLNFPEYAYNELIKYFDVETVLKSEKHRELYNKIVLRKWDEQYTCDMRYLQDCAKAKGTFLALPFYSEEFNKFASSIPFKLAVKSFLGKSRYNNKKTIINKFILRQCLKDKINDKVYYRDKAVSSNRHLIYAGALGDIIKKDLNNEFKMNKEFLKRYSLIGIVEQFLNLDRKYLVDDSKFLLQVYHVWILVKYNKLVINEKQN